jgi:ParB family chromosome partitioning protein
MIINIAVTKLHPHPDNPRKDLGDLAELSQSIKTQGVLQNLTIVPQDIKQWESLFKFHENIPDTVFNYESGYTVIIGHRRLEAAKLAELAEVPCAIAAEMDAHEQIATMLSENIQRTDLKLNEQVYGMQMMLDMGDTISTIAQRTGFADSTVRKRVALTELDKKKFAESVERGGRISDYEALNKIKDIKTRNKVLEKIGTDNFKWTLETALSKEKQTENKAKIVAILKGFATKINEKDSGKYQNVRYISLDSAKLDIPEDADSVKYFYTDSSSYMYLYKERQEQEKPKKSPEEIAREQKNKQLKALFRQGYDLRLAFAKDFKATSKMNALVFQKSAEVLLNPDYRYQEDVFRAVFGIDQKFRRHWEDSDKGETFDKALERVLEEHKKTAATTMLFWGIYCRAERDDRNCLSWSGNFFQSNKELSELYDILVSFGYSMSDEEKSLLDGTHELYDVPALPAQSGTNEEDDDSEDPCEACVAAHPECDECCAECEEPCDAAQKCRRESDGVESGEDEKAEPEENGEVES